VVAAAETELAPAVEPVGTITHGTMTFGGRERTYRLYVPSVLPAGPVPLFIGLHGGTGWGDQFARTNHIEGLAESNGFIVVHPDGVKVANGPGGVWNGGTCCGVAARDDVDDVGFVNTLLDSLEGQYAIDPARVYAFGHSNGAIMSYRLACELSDRIVGVGMYAGTLGIDTCAPTDPVSIIQAHGVADRNIPLVGGQGSESIAGTDFAPPHDGFDSLAAADGCAPTVSNTVRDITTERREPCSDSTAAVFVTIATANHSWPDGTPLVTPANGAGYVGYDVTAEIVSFLLAHPRR
jgi:polyhydroxybutyrate depolymerase